MRDQLAKIAKKLKNLPRGWQSMASLMKDNLSFCPELAELIGAGKANGRSSTAQNVLGLSTVNNLVVLRNLFTEITPKRTLEVGLGFGGSGMVFTSSHHRQARHRQWLNTLQSIHSKPTGTIWR